MSSPEREWPPPPRAGQLEIMIWFRRSDNRFINTGSLLGSEEEVVSYRGILRMGHCSHMSRSLLPPLCPQDVPFHCWQYPIRSGRVSSTQIPSYRRISKTLNKWTKSALFRALMIYPVHNSLHMYFCTSYQQHVKHQRPCVHGSPFLCSGPMQDAELMPRTFLPVPPAPIAGLFLHLLPSPGAACSIHWCQPLRMTSVECFCHSQL